MFWVRTQFDYSFIRYLIRTNIEATFTFFYIKPIYYNIAVIFIKVARQVVTVQPGVKQIRMYEELFYNLLIRIRIHHRDIN